MIAVNEYPAVMAMRSPATPKFDPHKKAQARGTPTSQLPTKNETTGAEVLPCPCRADLVIMLAYIPSRESSCEIHDSFRRQERKREALTVSAT